MRHSPFKGRTAVFDIDDTMANLRLPLERLLIAESGIPITHDDWKHGASAEENYNVSKERFFELMMTNNVIGSLEPHGEARPFLEYVQESGGHIVIVTARKWNPLGEEITSTWLSEHKFPHDILEVVQVTDDKAEVVKHYQPIFTVDDSVTHCLSYQKSGAVDHVFLYSMPWNRDSQGALLQKGIKTIHNLWDIQTVIEGKS
jgi:uncharacterized HAD superfamily protein